MTGNSPFHFISDFPPIAAKSEAFTAPTTAYTVRKIGDFCQLVSSGGSCFER